MLYSENIQPVIIITGMHRSGTSLVASILQSAGLEIGRTLLQADHGNTKGYFENVDFLNLHQDILYSLGINKAGWTLERNISPPPYYTDRAKELIEKNASQVNPWGWKDPRTSLFLKFWISLLPTAKFVFIYRSPWEVIDSLFRRTDDIFSHNPDLALKTWINYNQAILDFYLDLQEQCLLLNLASVIEQSSSLIEAIQKKLGIVLDAPSLEILDKSLLVNQPYDSHRPNIIKNYFPEAFTLYEKLNDTSGFYDKFITQYNSLEPSPSWLLQDWLSLRQSNKIFAWKMEYVQSELHQSQAQLEQTQGELHQSQAQLEQTQGELHQSRAQLEQTRGELHQSQAQLEQTQGELHQSRAQLEQTQGELHQSRAQLEQTQGELHQSRAQLEQTQGELHQSRAQLEQTQGELHQSQAQLEQTQGELHQSRAQLEQTQGELHQSQAQLEQTQGELHQSQAQLEQTQGELHQSQAQLEQTQGELHDLKTAFEEIQNQLWKFQDRCTAMESSKFWKLRKLWFQFKEKFGLSEDE